jgi:alkaline phosphatase
MQFLLFKQDGKIVIKGDGIYIGAACGKLVNEHMSVNDGVLSFNNLDKRGIYAYTTPEKCDSVIFMIGDGMGDIHINLGEKKHGFSFVARQFPYKGTSITRSQTVIEGKGTYTDSAASGTAMATGFKTYNGYLGLDKDGNSVPNVRELAASVGAKTAVLTTDKITGATPSAYLAHNASRENSMELENEINELIEQNKVDFCLGNAYDLTTETKNALNKISSNKSKFFIMIEEGWIDKQSHNNSVSGTATMVQRFNDSIEYATQFALMHPNTALIVTADHETGDLREHTIFKEGFGFQSENHTNKDVSIFALGAGTEIFNGARVENIELAKFVASVYSSEPFGMDISELN